MKLISCQSWRGLYKMLDTRDSAARKRVLLHHETTNIVIGAFFKVYNRLGYGFLEIVYRRALAIELRRRGLAAAEEVPLTVLYEGVVVGNYRADILVNDAVVLEIKTGERMHPQDEAQLLNLLKASRIEVGMLLHFGWSPTFKRMILTAPTKRA